MYIYIYILHAVSSFSFGWFWFDHIWLVYTYLTISEFDTRVWPHSLAQKLQLWTTFLGTPWLGQTWGFFAPNFQGANRGSWIKYRKQKALAQQNMQEKLFMFFFLSLSLSLSLTLPPYLSLSLSLSSWLSAVGESFWTDGTQVKWIEWFWGGKMDQFTVFKRTTSSSQVVHALPISPLRTLFHFDGLQGKITGKSTILMGKTWKYYGFLEIFPPNNPVIIG